MLVLSWAALDEAAVLSERSKHCVKLYLVDGLTEENSHGGERLRYVLAVSKMAHKLPERRQPQAKVSNEDSAEIATA
jgi:hypothetical protein